MDIVKGELIFITLAISRIVVNGITGFTYARSPSDYCNKVESSPEKILVINEDGALEEVKNPDFNQSSHSVHQHAHFPIDLNYPLASSFGAGGSTMDLDLNQLPPDEEK